MAKKIDNEILGGELTDCPNDKYRKFFDKFNEIEHLNIIDWRPTHILAYFCKKYQETYQVKYQFKFNSPSPLKSFEIFNIKKLAMLLSSNPQILKDYIDWIYLEKVTKAKRRLTSISFMTHEGLVNDYKINVLLSGKKGLNINRSTELPAQYALVFREAGVTMKTYGELAFMSQMSNMSQSLLDAFNKISELGFDREILSRIV